MVSPPTSLPSPTPSSSSYPRPSFSSLPPPPRTASTSSASSRSHLPSGSISNGYPSDMYPIAPSGDRQQYGGGGYYDDPNHTPSAPPPNHLHPHPPHVPYQNPHNAVFLPPVSSSPPPTVPQYVPPPQHQMAPDPIHHLNQLQLQQQQIPVGPGPGGQNGWGWRPPPNPPGMGQYHYRPGQGQNGGQEYRGGSGPGRDRRRREREEEGGQEEEVITTIFVVGFPDDMLEREFQNIFTFAPGFEAATLKFPSGRLREPTAALLAELTHLASLREARSRDPSAGSSEDPHDPQIAQQQAALEEALANLHIPPLPSHTATTSTSTTPSALTPSILTPGPGITRRQTIGFARFKTRLDALAAREQLQGRKIDYLTGATLKAEMAKKNLHTKRTTSGEELVGLLLRSGRLAGLVGGLREGSVGRGEGREAYLQGNANGGGSTSAREAWEAWPAVQQQQQSGGPDLLNRDLRQYPATEDFSHVQYQHQQLPQSRSSFSQPPHPNVYGSFTPQPNPYPSQSHNYSPLHPVSSHSTGPTSPPLSSKSPVPLPHGPAVGPGLQDSKALLALAEETDELDLEMEWNAYGAGGAQEYTPRRPERAYAGMTGYGMNGYGGLPGQGQVQQRGDLGTSPSATSDALSETGRSMGNPADQNPPINTLYVGNLPAISPPTHPPNFLEESLRALFQRLPGFKRMSFRQKINGPMCFVEFEDVGYATLAIKEMYGCNLNGLVKGGIRLSYSKNSLGQRGHSHASGQNSSMFGGIAHTVALAGMSNNPSPNHTHSQSFSSLGLSHTQPQPQSQGTTGRDSTTLSPTAQPFTIPINPTANNNSSSSSTGSGSNYATSPRSRYFSSPPNTNTAAQATSPNSFTSFAPSSANSFTANGTGNANGNGNVNANGPVSPKPLPNFSWVSTGTGSIGNGYSSTGAGFDGFPSSLGGVASTWGSRASG